MSEHNFKKFAEELPDEYENIIIWNGFTSYSSGYYYEESELCSECGDKHNFQRIIKYELSGSHVVTDFDEEYYWCYAKEIFTDNKELID